MSLRPLVSKEDHMQGNPDAPIELLEYGDYQCPYCGRAYPIIKKLQLELGDRMKFIFRNEMPPRDSKSEVEIDDSAALLYE